MKCHIRTKFGSTAAFGRRIEAFYAQIDWNIEMEERGGLRSAAQPRPNPQDGGRTVREAAVIDLAAILAVEMLALGDEAVAQRLAVYKGSLKAKIEKANKDLAELKYDYKTN